MLVGSLRRAATGQEHCRIIGRLVGEWKDGHGAISRRRWRRQRGIRTNFARISPRAQKPFVAVNCAAIPDQLVESELFGVEKGAFTGATASRAGRFERANGGTLFLDEIGVLSLAAQGKLPRALQEGEIERVGDTEVRRVDVRLIAATNLNLKEEAHAGRFREDLYFRLNVVPMKVPPLRERRDDIPILMNHFLLKYCHRHPRVVTGFIAP
jgi:two-component system response regulator HydG